MRLKRLLKIVKGIYRCENICYIYIPNEIIFSGHENINCDIGSLYRYINKGLILFAPDDVDILYKISYTCLNKIKKEVNEVFYKVKIKSKGKNSITIMFIYKEKNFIIVTLRDIHRYSDTREFMNNTISYILKNINLNYIDEIKLYIPINGITLKIQYNCNFTYNLLYIVLLNTLILSMNMRRVMSSICPT
uniref:Uncharacterized protein n=1 Tax=Ignisphaera aggregans TaxID=334771 RepID=A0A7C5XQ12_9CREN